LAVLLGPSAEGLGATNICRLERLWEDEWKGWSRRDLWGKRYVQVWADGIYFNVRLEDAGNGKQCILVLIGATADGKKELIGITDGCRQSEQSWAELLRALQSRGPALSPRLAAASGSLTASRRWPREGKSVIHNF